MISVIPRSAEFRVRRTVGFPRQCRACTPNRGDDAMTDWTKLAGDLERLLKLRSHVFGMKLFESRAEMEAIPRIRRPQSIHTLDQVVGESAWADSWGRALKTRTPSLSIPCFAERRYGGVLDDEMLMALPPDYLPKAIAGMEALAKNGLRYPFPQYGIQQDVRAGMAVSYPGRAG